MPVQHPITPPPELIEQWQDESPETQIADHIQYLATRAAQWGSDQELEACCEWLADQGYGIASDQLPAARRPKPPSLKEQALNDLDTIQTHDSFGFQIIDLSNIRRAVETLPND